jgi:hypothetical protein
MTRIRWDFEEGADIEEPGLASARVWRAGVASGPGRTGRGSVAAVRGTTCGTDRPFSRAAPRPSEPRGRPDPAAQSAAQRAPGQ